MTREEAIKIIESNCSCSGSKLREACAMFIPELAESEDERIKKEMLNSLKEAEDSIVLTPFKKKSWIAYLEKLKEQKPIDIDFVSDWLRKHIKTYVNSEYNEFHKTVEYDGSINIERLIEDLKKAIEQQPFVRENDFASKPAEWNKDIICKAVKEIGLTQHQINWFNNNVFPPKQEWSEEDEKNLEKCISHMINIIPVPGKHGLEDMSFEKHTDEELVTWLNLLPKRFNLQPKQEWSEEDEKDIQEASDCLRDYANNYVQGGNSKLYLQSLADRIESLRLQPHWKPSEEQMEWLESAVRLSTDKPYIHEIIISLYEQLKKL